MGEIGAIHVFPSRRFSDLDHLLIDVYSDEYPVTVADVNRDI